VDFDQIYTFDPATTFNDLAVLVRGTWAAALTCGVDGLPAGGARLASGPPVPPGTSAGDAPIALVGVQLPATVAPGTYVVWLWASDGATRSGVPVTLRVLRPTPLPSGKFDPPARSRLAPASNR
jgi:hypothetical protein